MIRQKELFEYWDNNHNFINTCTLKEGNNIINLIKKIPNIYVNRILLIIKFYMISINKIYMKSSTILIIYNYLNDSNINSLHILYGLCRDYWNILIVNGHPNVAVCYHNTNFDLYDSETYYHEKLINFENNLIPFLIGNKLPSLFKLTDLNSYDSNNNLDI
jgi:hypothetical protein